MTQKLILLEAYEHVGMLVVVIGQSAVVLPGSRATVGRSKQ